MQFKQIVGQNAVKKRLINAVQENRISHAQLLLGPEGSGNLALALAYAQYIQCTNKQADDSCGECLSCLKMQKIAHPDVHYTYPMVGSKVLSTEKMPEWREAILRNPYQNVSQWLQCLEAENKQGNITVDECHYILQRLSLKSFESEYKILILWMPEYLGNAGNTLLKIIEEPPEKTLFLLVSNNDGQIISTITSRTQLIKVPRLTDAEITEGLVAKCSIGSTEAAGIAHLSDGNFNTALQLHEEGSTDKGFAQIYLQWLRDCYSYTKMAGKLIAWVDEIPKLQREGQKNFLQYGMHITRECLMMNYGSPDLVRLFGEELDGFQKLSPFIHQGNATDIYESLNLACQHIERNANPRIVFMDLSLKMAKLLHSKQQ